MKSRSKVVEWWPETLEHISSTWQKKKGRKYPFTGQDLKHIKQLRNWLTAPELMAMFVVYLSSSPYWGRSTGYLISGMWQERSILLEDPNFKKLVAQYEKELGMKESKEVALELFPKGDAMKILALLIVGLLTTHSFACGKGCIEYNGTCACDQAAQADTTPPIKPSDDQPRKGPQPEWETGEVKADSPKSLIYSDAHIDELKADLQKKTPIPNL